MIAAALARPASRIVAQPPTRRFASRAYEGMKVDNSAFVKEREAVKKHAAESSGSLLPSRVTVQGTDDDAQIFGGSFLSSEYACGATVRGRRTDGVGTDLSAAP